MCIAFAAGAYGITVLDAQRYSAVVAGDTAQSASNAGAAAKHAGGQRNPTAQAGAPSETPRDEMAVLINDLRAQQNLPPVKVNPQLSASAQAYAQRMADDNFFGHNDPDDNCSKPYERMQSAGYVGWTHASENIAAGQPTASEAMAGFRASPSHYKTLVNPNLREVGLGFVIELSDTDNVRIISSCPNYDRQGGPYLYYWVQDFASRQITTAMPILPIIINNEAFATDSRRVSLYIYGSAAGQPVWANQMRFSEDNANWSDYEVWQERKSYLLSPDVGQHTVYTQLKHIDPATQAESAQIFSDTIYLDVPTVPDFIATAFLFLPATAR